MVINLKKNTTSFQISRTRGRNYWNCATLVQKMAVTEEFKLLGTGNNGYLQITP